MLRFHHQGNSESQQAFHVHANSVWSAVARRRLERFRAKACPGLDPGWKPVRIKKTRQIRNLEPRFDSIEAEKAPVSCDRTMGVPHMTVVRISLGRFDASRYAVVRKLLDESQASLIPAIRALNGNLAYYVGIDQENSTMTNVSIWSSPDAAKQMASLPAMLALAKSFTETGVSFERPITNHETLWSISDAA
jgi:quinol monooxygenase YgiN